jgi:hypothetical protein
MEKEIEHDVHRLVLLAEGRAEALPNLLRLLGDEAKVVSCTSVFGDIEGDSESFKDFFWGSPHTKGLSLQQAPYADNFHIGLSLIKTSFQDRTLVIPNDSLVGRQLGQIEVENLSENPEVAFPAVDALRHVVAAFDRYPVNVGKAARFPSEDWGNGCTWMSL